MSIASSQNKQREIAFFDAYAAEADYDVFTADSNARLIEACVRLLGIERGARIVDLGCGSGVFTDLLRRAGYTSIGVDISSKSIAIARRKCPGIDFIEGDVENLPFPDESFDGALLGGLVHHFPDPARCAAELHRVLRRGGRFVAFDPNRRNPFIWLYRDRTSPFYSPIGVTENERPVLAADVAAAFARAGFEVGTSYLSRVRYRYIASSRARFFLPLYNALGAALFWLPLVRPFGSFVLTFGEKA